jgi:hypothetical protein
MMFLFFNDACNKIDVKYEIIKKIWKIVPNTTSDMLKTAEVKNFFSSQS